MGTHPARLPLADVVDLMAPGQPLPFRVFDAAGRLLLAQGQRIVDERQLALLIERGASVERDEAEAVRRVREAAAGATPPQAVRTPSWFDHFERQVWALDDLLRALLKGGPRGGARGEGVSKGGSEGRGENDVEVDPLDRRLGVFGDAFVALVERQPDAALFLVVRQDDKRHSLYALTHALHAATVAQLAAGQLGWDAAGVRRAVLAALTMNASILELQGRMAEQKDPPTKAQLDQIRAHPHRSAGLLAAAGVADEAWLQAVSDHHERRVGGYPRGDVEPDELARLVRAADVFTAKISPRALRAPLAPQVAARQLFQEEGGGPLAAALIRAVGIYPPGDLVTLKNGETAVVVARASAGGNLPQVAALLSAHGKPIVGAPRRDTREADTTIVGPLADRSRIGRVLPEVVYGLLN